eukprot:9464437-Pyramimonas_sp.AAC.1
MSETTRSITPGNCFCGSCVAVLPQLPISDVVKGDGIGDPRAMITRAFCQVRSTPGRLQIMAMC